MIKTLCISLLLLSLIGCAPRSTHPSPASAQPLHRLLLLGQQNVNNLSVMQLFKDTVRDEPTFEDVFDDLSTEDYNRMASMLNQHLLGYFTTPAGIFSMDPKKSDRCCLTIELENYEVLIDTMIRQNVWYGSDSINGTFVRQTDSLSGTCVQGLDSLTVSSKQFLTNQSIISYSENEGQGCLMDCTVLYHYNMKLMDDGSHVVLEKECTVSFKSKIIVRDKGL